MEKVSLKSKLNQIRLALSISMNKSGKNSYSKYEYFQLKDFMPQALKLCNELGVFTVFFISKDKFELPSKTSKTMQYDDNGNVITEVVNEEENYEYKEIAHLIAYNIDDEEDCLELTKETANVNLSGAQPIQNLGGKSTYMKRYMYMDLFEINENDKVEEETGKPVTAAPTTVSSTKPAIKPATKKKEEIKEEPVVQAPVKEEVKSEPVVENNVDTSELMTMEHKIELANYMKEKGLDPRTAIIEAAKELGTDVPLLKESDFEKVKEIIDRKGE